MRLTRGLQVLGALVTSLFLLGAFTPAVNLLAYWRAPSRALGPAAAIVVLGKGGTTESGQLSRPSIERITEAIELYRQGLAPILTVSGSPAARPRTKAEARAEAARASGIDPVARAHVRLGLPAQRRHPPRAMCTPGGRFECSRTSGHGRR
jgi:uncharacterized SAM-binding protein YcdF (DUF218 family)